MPEGVGRGIHPQAHVQCKPGAAIVFGVAVLGSFVSAQDVFKVAVRKDATLRTAHDHQAFRRRVHPGGSPGQGMGNKINIDIRIEPEVSIHNSDALHKFFLMLYIWLCTGDDLLTE